MTFETLKNMAIDKKKKQSVTITSPIHRNIHPLSTSEIGKKKDKECRIWCSSP